MPKTHIVEVGRKALDVIEDKTPQRQVVVEHLEANLGCIPRTLENWLSVTKALPIATP
jgi:hypothetical protein